MKQDKKYISIISEDGHIIIELPKEFESHFDIFNHDEFKEFVNKKYQNKVTKDGTFILNQVLSGERITVLAGQSGVGKSMFEHIPEFIKLWNKNKRIEKIKRILNE
ncbi:MAG: hypothetical protein RLZZ546_2851 [Bacteroidota bacterium]|jgi:hypothetical protein